MLGMVNSRVIASLGALSAHCKAGTFALNKLVCMPSIRHISLNAYRGAGAYGTSNQNRRSFDEDEDFEDDFEPEEREGRRAGFIRRSNASNNYEREENHGGDRYRQRDGGGQAVEEFSYDKEQRFPRRFRAGLNRVSLLGGIAQRPIERTGRSGQPYIQFNLITNTSSRRATGDLVEYNEMHSVMAFGPLARYAVNNLDRGTRVYVSGRLHYTGGVPLSDGTRSPRVTCVNAEHIVPFNLRQARNRDDGEEEEEVDELGEREVTDMDLEGMEDQRAPYARRE